MRGLLPRSWSDSKRRRVLLFVTFGLAQYRFDREIAPKTAVRTVRDEAARIGDLAAELLRELGKIAPATRQQIDAVALASRFRVFREAGATLEEQVDALSREGDNHVVVAAREALSRLRDAALHVNRANKANSNLRVDRMEAKAVASAIVKNVWLYGGIALPLDSDEVIAALRYAAELVVPDGVRVGDDTWRATIRQYPPGRNAESGLALGSTDSEPP